MEVSARAPESHRHRPAADPGVRAPALAYLLAVGGALAAISVLVPRPRGTETIGVLIPGALGLVGGLLLWAYARHIRTWGIHLALAFGTGCVTIATYYAGGESAYALYYVWVGVYAFYFFRAPAAILHVTLVAVAYGLTLALGDAGYGAEARWGLTMGTVIVAGTLVERLAREVREQAEDLTTIAGVARELSAVTDAHGARVAVCRAATEVADANIAVLFEPDASGRELVSTAGLGIPGQIRLPFAAEPSGAGVAFSTLEPFFVADLEGHPSVSQRLVQQLGVSSAIWQPVVRNGIAIGVLTVTWVERMPEASDRLRSLLRLLADEAAVAIERANLLVQLETVARTDELTGLANRRAWDQELPRELARAEREQTDVCVAMLDLDRFKQFNDENGHQAGDRLLRRLAAIWRETLRPTDFVARYGGEEFVVLLPGCPLERALPVIERLRGASPSGQSCSAGIACWDGEEGPDELIDRADVALYRAKAEGRDRTVAAG